MTDDPDPEPVPHLSVRQFAHAFAQIHEQLGIPMPEQYLK